MSSADELNSYIEEWNQLDTEYASLETAHKQYLQAMGNLQKAESKCIKAVQHHQYRSKQILSGLNKLKELSQEQSQERNDLVEKIENKNSQLGDIVLDLPKSNGLYLRIVLGSVNLSLNNAEKHRYKDEYERFKLIVTICILLISLACIIFNYRVIDAIMHFLLVWYYCTLTIRESILYVNGSRIKGWWRVHHFITTIQAGIIIVWPDGIIYGMFRRQFTWYVCYISFVQFLQYYYQQGCLYRLRALGERHNMDITIDGFRSWMWRGLSFLLPFLYFGYLFQLYNFYTLFVLSQLPSCNEWQVPVSSIIFFILSLGNMSTTSVVIYHKFRGKWTFSSILKRKTN